MSGFHVLHPSWSSGCTVVSNSDASAEFAASNLLRVQPSWFWRSAGLTAGATPLRLTFDTGSPKPWDFVSLLYTNAFSGTIRVRGNNSTGTLFTSPDFDSISVGTFNLLFPGDLSMWPDRHVLVRIPTTQTHRYIGVEIVDASNPDGHFDAGVAVIGATFTPDRGAALGSGMGYDDPSVEVEMGSNESQARPKRSKAVGQWNLPDQSKADAEMWRWLNYAYGKKIPVIFKWDPLDGLLYEQNTFVYGRMQWRSGGAITYAHATANVPGGLYDVQVGIKEL